MLKLSYTNQFNRDLKKVQKRGKKISKLNEIVSFLQNEKALSERHRNHKLSGNYADHWECHIEPDWLLIYLRNSKAREITLVRTGTHADLF
jgi:mRNA interferase YafQ